MRRRNQRSAEVKIPEFPLRPGRQAFSTRTRLILAVVLVAAVVVSLVVGALLAGSSKAPLRSVTIPPADRAASQKLVLAAEAVGFRPPGHTSGVGQIEDEPASAATPPSGDLLPVGAWAPRFTLRTPTGAPVSLASLRGKAVLLEFFATWCPHCAAEAPHLRELYASLPRAAYAFVSIDGNGGDAPSIFAYHVYYGLPFPAVLDPGGRSATFPSHGSPGTVSKRYRISTYPTFYVIDPKGVIAWRSTGEQPDALLRVELRAAAGGSAAPVAGSGRPAACAAGCSNP
jgi:peroxiredoxin